MKKKEFEQFSKYEKFSKEKMKKLTRKQLELYTEELYRQFTNLKHFIDENECLEKLD